jgi:hypothetical protein
VILARVFYESAQIKGEFLLKKYLTNDKRNSERRALLNKISLVFNYAK